MPLHRLAAIVLLAAGGFGVANAAAAPPSPDAGATTWSSTWNSALQESISVSGWTNQTLRMVARVSLGGTSLRVHLADPFGSTPVQFGHVTVGIELNGGTTTAPPVAATFGGAQSLSLPTGGSAVSDPIALTVPANTRLLVSLYLAAGQNITTAPVHATGLETEYNHLGGDISANQSYATSNDFGFTTYLDGVDVQTPAAATVVVTGDSISDGVGTTLDTDARWPNYLAARTAPAGFAVIDQGINADKVTQDGSGLPSVTTRWARDALGQPGVRTVIEQGGINDLRAGVTAATLESAQSALIASAHAAGVRVLLTTLTPCAGDAQCTAAVDAQRLAYNTWVRTGGSPDGFVDFAAAVGGWFNSAGQEGLNPQYDSGDHLHPDAAGYAVMVNAIDPSQL